MTAFLLLVDVFMLLTAYYLIKPAREALILMGAGTLNRPAMEQPAAA